MIQKRIETTIMFMFGRGAQQSFSGQYRCFPVSFIEKSSAEQGDKIFLPPSALNRLAQLHIEYPMLFRAENKRSGKYTHCGVLEFIADEGSVYLPYWMMKHLGIKEGDILTLTNASLPKGSYVKLQPHSTDFLDISNPRAVLETTLRGFSCLTVGDTIPIHYNDRVYQINIVESKPEDAISVIETDCNVDFAPPLDYQEPSMASGTSASASGYQGTQERTDHGTGSEKVKDMQEKGFAAFIGSARRLDGKPSIPVAVSQQQTDSSATQAAPVLGRKKSGKLMFKDRLAAKFNDPSVEGVSGSASARQSKQDASNSKTTVDSEGSSFKAFQGKSYRLS